MRFDESQSRGLKNHLIRELELQTRAALDVHTNKLDDSYVIAGSLNSLKRMSDGLQRGLKKFSILSYSGFTNNKKFYAFSNIESSSKREYNTWEEKCLYSQNVLLSQKVFEFLGGTYNISEHAITRIFQRNTFPENFDTQKDIFHVLNELKFLPAYAAYWNRFSLNFTINLGIKKFDIIIPAPSGVFIGEINDPKTPMLEVRTYLSLEMLDAKQKQIRNIYIEAMKDLNESPLPFFLLLECYTQDNVELEAKILSGRLLQSFEMIFNEMIAVEDVILDFDWSIARLKEKMGEDAFLDKNIIDQLPFHPIKRDNISRKLKLKSFIKS
jgi:hypothetical protein